MSSQKRLVNDIIDAIELESKHDDSFTAGTKRYFIQRWARKGLQEFSEKYSGDVKALRVRVSEKNYIDMPDDYIKALRVSEFSECGNLKPIAVNSRIMVGNTYLLDNQDRILLDHNGTPLLGSADGDIDRNCTIYNFDYTDCPYYRHANYYSGQWGSYGAFSRYYNLNNTFAREVTMREDNQNKRIQFSGRQLDEVLIEYNFNPLKSYGTMDLLEIDRHFADALEKYVYHGLVANKRSVPQSEKHRAKQELKEALILAKMNKLMFSIADLSSTTNLK